MLNILVGKVKNSKCCHSIIRCGSRCQGSVIIHVPPACRHPPVFILFDFFLTFFGTCQNGRRILSRTCVWKSRKPIPSLFAFHFLKKLTGKSWKKLTLHVKIKKKKRDIACRNFWNLLPKKINKKVELILASWLGWPKWLSRAPAHLFWFNDWDFQTCLDRLRCDASSIESETPIEYFEPFFFPAFTFRHAMMTHWWIFQKKMKINHVQVIIAVTHFLVRHSIVEQLRNQVVVVIIIMMVHFMSGDDGVRFSM